MNNSPFSTLRSPLSVPTQRPPSPPLFAPPAFRQSRFIFSWREQRGGPLLLVLVVGAFFMGTSFAQLRKATPVADASGENYYAIDSDDPITDARWHPTYNFVDTNYRHDEWHRIYPGSKSIPVSQPQGVAWHGLDTTENTFAGPIPIGFSFNFY